MHPPVAKPPQGELTDPPANTATGPADFRVALRVIGVPQISRLCLCLIALAIDAFASRCADVLRSDAARTAARARLRGRSARRVVAALGSLKGVFVKAGQFAAMRHDVLPSEALEAFATLRSRVRPIAFERIARVVEAELGAPIDSAFAEFERDPIGAASLAQAHRARLLTGEAVVVKVQYPWLGASLPTDLALIRMLLRLWMRRLPEADWKRVFDEFAAGLAGELDFRAEARVAEEIAHNLSRDPRIVVPAPIHSHTSRRVLTMTQHPVIPISDPGLMATAGVDPCRVIEIIARAYAKQIFADGLFHADPHPGNFFVIDEAGATDDPRVLFIDFGLSRRLDPALRHEMRLGLYALMQRDVDAFVAGMDRMGMIADGAHSSVRSSVQAMFDRIAEAGVASDGSSARILGLKDEAKSLLQQTAGIQLPMDLLFYAKTVSYLFALGEELAPEVDVMKLSLPYLLQFLAQKD
jgi:predicted unusual protein kinase regulating ubiquinone biosynthesis (AarF/ABC1/UbiB family)